MSTLRGKSKINVGLVGLGRMGLAYGRYLSGRVPGVTLTAISDLRPDAVEAARLELGVAKAYADYQDLVTDPDVDAVVVVTPTKRHSEVVIAAAAAKKAIFCEKPPAVTLEDALGMQAAIAQQGVFFQLGFMRRFDSGYAAAKKKILAGAIGEPCVFTATSKDQVRPPLDYLRPENSGGLFVDMGIHDFDLARWFMGDVSSVYSTAGVLAYPEIKPIGDWDSALANLRFKSGCIGMVNLGRKAVHGYGIYAEIAGTEGTIRIGYDRETPILILTKDAVTHDTIPSFEERFENAFVAQLQDFARNLVQDRPPSITIEDGISALKISLAATRSARTNQIVEL